MSEWNVIYENFHTKHSVLTAPDEHMPYIIQLHIMSIRWAYYEQMKHRETQKERQREKLTQRERQRHTQRQRQKLTTMSSPTLTRSRIDARAHTAVQECSTKGVQSIP